MNTSNLHPAAIAELNRIYLEQGELQPRVVLETARDAESPLHPFFDWKDSLAAEKWRLHQATQLIIRVRVTIETGDEVRHWVNVSKADDVEGRYVPFSDAMKRPSYQAVILDQARAEMESFVRKYEIYQTCAELVNAARRGLDRAKAGKARRHPVG